MERIGLDDFKGLFQPKWFYDSVTGPLFGAAALSEQNLRSTAEHLPWDTMSIQV